MADISAEMMISEEQVRRAVEYLHTPECSAAAHSARPDVSDISPDLLERIRSMVETAPDMRDDRIEQARALLDGPGPSSSDVAAKMIGRILSDAIR